MKTHLDWCDNVNLQDRVSTLGLVLELSVIHFAQRLVLPHVQGEG